jgi:hypothetical protein
VGIQEAVAPDKEEDAVVGQTSRFLQIQEKNHQLCPCNARFELAEDSFKINYLF